jgi:nitrogenase molybdenum-cofactor synthesis protein NifE
MARLLVSRGADSELIDRTEALIAREEAIAYRRLEDFKPKLAGKKVLLNTGGVKSWSMVHALQEVGMEIVRSSIKKSTDEDKARVLELLKDEKHLFNTIPPRDIFRMLESGETDIMLSGSRTQFIALKARKPWVDVNQERNHPYAGYEGAVELVRRIHLALSNPVFAATRVPAPWDDEGRLTLPFGPDAAAADRENDAVISHSFAKFRGSALEDSDDC